MKRMDKLKFLVGADPELFLFKGGKFFSAHGMIPGNKHNPYVVPSGAVQVDGMALEFNIDPADSEEQFLNNIMVVRSTLEGMVPDYQIVAEPTATFDHEYMLAQPPESKILGCDPDYNAWEDGMRNPPPDGRVDFRTGAGHVHIGWCSDMDVMNEGHFDACVMAAKQLDCVLGLGSLLYDSDNTRRTLYGKAGAFRPKSYGVEYRTLSNAWLKSGERIRWVYRSTIGALNKLMEGRRLWEEVPNGHIQYLINSPGDLEDRQIEAAGLLESFGFEGA